MKKIILVFMLLVGNIALTFAQNDTVIYMADHPGYTNICLNRIDRVLVYGPESCQDYLWTVRINGGYEQNPEGNPLIINGVFDDSYSIRYNGCDLSWNFNMHFTDDRWVPTSFTHEVWKHQGETMMLQAVENVGDSIYYDFYWSTGEGGYSVWEIPISEPGVYTCQIPAMCGTAVRTFIVKDGAEIELATCDLSSNLNVVTWQTTPAQAAYISQVIIKRDGMQVGTAPYEDGQFIDNIGSDAASRTYTITAIDTDGVPCPIESYPKETIHMAYLTGINNTIEVNWNSPTGYELLGYNICEWHPGSKDGDLTVIDYVGAGVTSYTCSESMFDQGNVVVQGVEAGKTESRLLSNRSWETVGIGEHQSNSFSVYPNPTNGTFTVQGAKTLTIYNTMGQVVARGQNENETHSFTLAPGVYFVKSGEGTVKKVIVE